MYNSYLCMCKCRLLAPLFVSPNSISASLYRYLAVFSVINFQIYLEKFNLCLVINVFQKTGHFVFAVMWRLSLSYIFGQIPAISIFVKKLGFAISVPSIQSILTLHRLVALFIFFRKTLNSSLPFLIFTIFCALKNLKSHGRLKKILYFGLNNLAA